MLVLCERCEGPDTLCWQSCAVLAHYVPEEAVFVIVCNANAVNLLMLIKIYEYEGLGLILFICDDYSACKQGAPYGIFALLNASM